MGARPGSAKPTIRRSDSAAAPAAVPELFPNKVEMVTEITRAKPALCGPPANELREGKSIRGLALCFQPALLIAEIGQGRSQAIEFRGQLAICVVRTW